MTADRIALSRDAVTWLYELAWRVGWVSANEVAPCECFRPLIWMGLVEQDDVSFRITDLGAFALATCTVVP